MNRNPHIRKLLAVGIIPLFVGTCIIPAISQETEKALQTSKEEWLYVGGSGSGNYSRIQDAIYNASNGDTVFVYNDSSPYYERILINKSINLIGEGRDSTVIDGNYQGNVVEIQSDHITVNGFKIINCVMENQTKYVIHISDSRNVVIKDNNISVGKNFPIYGIYGIGIVLENSSNNLIENNIIFKDGEECVTVGISIMYNSNDNNISGNEVYGYSTGIDIEDSNNIVFYANNIHHNEYGMLINGNNNDIITNKIDNNSHIGIRLFLCTNSLVYKNTITNNGFYVGSGHGIQISRCSSIRIINNNISNNKDIGIFIDYPKTPSIRNIVSKNNFINNGKSAYFYKFLLPIFITRWNENYWSDTYNNSFLLKIIYGEVHINTYSYMYIIKTINLDWHPAQEPYDIS